MYLYKLLVYNGSRRGKVVLIRSLGYAQSTNMHEQEMVTCNTALFKSLYPPKTKQYSTVLVPPKYNSIQSYY